MKKYTLYPQGVCCASIDVTLSDDDIIEQVEFNGGCPGNGLAVGRLLQGMPARKAIDILAGVDCGGKGTSCSDQLARTLGTELSRHAG